MANGKKDLHRPVIKVDRKRFAAGWRWVTKKIGKNGIIDLIPPKPDVVFDVIRPADLVALTVAGYGVQLIGGDNPRIVPKKGAKARLVVQFSFQHLAEEVIYETPNGPAKSPNDSVKIPIPDVGA